MTDATKPLPTDSKPVLGSNQWIGVGLTALPIVLSFGLVVAGKLDAKDWLTYAQVAATTGTGITLGGSAILKAIKELKK